MYSCFGSEHSVRHLTNLLLNTLLDEGDILQEAANKFHKAVRGFEIEALNYSKTRLPIKDDVVKHTRFLYEQRRWMIYYIVYTSNWTLVIKVWIYVYNAPRSYLLMTTILNL